MSIREYLDKIKPYLSNMINNLISQGAWKIHLTMIIKLFSSKDPEETGIIHTKSDNIETMIGQMRQIESLKNFLNFFCKDIKRLRRINERKQICFW